LKKQSCRRGLNVDRAIKANQPDPQILIALNQGRLQRRRTAMPAHLKARKSPAATAGLFVFRLPQLVG
jgi:hypothetical protein